jgi:uncharacterized coiled-coil DUF342 family protein
MTETINRPSWLSVAVGAFLLSAASSLVTVSLNYGKQEAALASLSAKNDEMKIEREKKDQEVKDLRQAFSNQQIQLQNTMARVQALRNDRCAPISAEVSNLMSSIKYPHTGGFDEQQIEQLQRGLDGYQKTLQACYASPL